MPIRFKTPNKIKMSPTEDCLERPTRVGITHPNKIIPLPTARTLSMIHSELDPRYKRRKLRKSGQPEDVADPAFL